MKMRTEEISPARAQKLLDNQVPNRKVKKAHVERMVHDIKSGRWILSTNPIVLDQEGRLGDGQHRMLAVIESGETLPFWVCKLEGDEDVLSIRMSHAGAIAPTAPDLLAFDRPEVTNRTKRLSIIRLLYCMENDAPISMKVSYIDLRDLMDKRGKDLNWIVDLAGSVVMTRLVPAHFCAFILWTMQPGRGGEDLREAAEGFAQRYASGANLASNSPELTLRDFMLAKSNTDRPTEIGRFASLFLDSLRGKARTRAQASRVAMDTIADRIKKKCPSWVSGRT